MKYNEDIDKNEAVAHSNGERELISWAEVKQFLGGDNTNGEVVEMLMDMVNGIYSIPDFLTDVREYDKEVGDASKRV